MEARAKFLLFLLAAGGLARAVDVRESAGAVVGWLQQVGGATFTVRETTETARSSWQLEYCRCVKENPLHNKPPKSALRQ